MFAVRRVAARAAGVRSFAATTKPVAAAAGAGDVDAEHKAWLESVKKYPIGIPQFEWTLEWVLPTPVPLHQFSQSPIVVEVKDRNPDPDNILYRGANVVGGYPHPETGKVVTREEHETLFTKTFKSKHTPDYQYAHNDD